MMRLRPMRSPQRGMMSENSAAAVKNAVWVTPICAAVVSSSFSIVARTGESMEALSWNATIAASSAMTTPKVPEAGVRRCVEVSVMTLLLRCSANPSPARWRPDS